jgi:hypothetical protein
MKVNVRNQNVKIGYGKAIVVCNFKQFCEQTEWINKGLIQKKVQEYAKYIEIKKELKAKGLIQ